MATLATMMVKAAVDTKEFDKGIARVERKTSGLTGSLGRMGHGVTGVLTSAAKTVAFVGTAAMGAGAAGAYGLYKMKNASTEVQASMAKSRTVFDSELASVEAWAGKNAAAIGLARQEAVGLATNFADLLIPMGFSREMAAGMSTDVVGLSGALSSWSNGQFTAVEVAERLNAAMLGEREGLKALGISISEADVVARLAANGQKDLTGAALEQAKALATQQLIFEKSTDAQTAFADGTETLYEKQLKQDAMWKQVRETVARSFIPVIESASEMVSKYLMPALGRFETWVVDHMPQIQATFDKVFSFVGKSANWITENIVPPLIDAFQRFRNWLKDHEGEIKAVWQGFQDKMDKLKTWAVEEVWPRIIKAMDALRAWLFDGGSSSNANKIEGIFLDMKDAMGSLLSMAEDAWPGIEKAISVAWKIAGPLLSAQLDMLGKMMDAYAALAKAGEKTFGALPGAINGALRAISGPVAAFLDVAGRIANAVGGVGGLGNTLTTAAKSASGWGQSTGGKMGGRVLERNRGGWVPGDGPNRDSVPAMLTPKEFVLNRGAASMFKPGFLEWANRAGRSGLGAAKRLGGDLGDIFRQGLNAGGWVKDAEEVLAWARTQVGSYLWGGFGPRYDCSGYQSAISNYAATGNPRSGGRWATALASGYPSTLGRFVKGVGDPQTGYTIGVRPTGWGGQAIGHTAGTIAGTNVESSGGRGSHVGGPVGWEYGPYKYHLPDFGGPTKEMTGWFGEIRDLIKELRSGLGSDLAEMFRDTALTLAKEVGSYLLEQVPFAGVLSKVVGKFHSGGEVGAVLQAGERVLSVEQNQDWDFIVSALRRLLGRSQAVTELVDGLRDLITRLGDGTASQLALAGDGLTASLQRQDSGIRAHLDGLLAYLNEATSKWSEIGRSWGAALADAFSGAADAVDWRGLGTTYAALVAEGFRDGLGKIELPWESGPGAAVPILPETPLTWSDIVTPTPAANFNAGMPAFLADRANAWLDPSFWDLGRPNPNAEMPDYLSGLPAQEPINWSDIAARQPQDQTAREMADFLREIAGNTRGGGGNIIVTSDDGIRKWRELTSPLAASGYA